MDRSDWLAERFEEQRPRLRGVAYRMLGSLEEADDALQDAWLRANRAGAGGVENLDGWLTTIVARVCLNLLRTRRRHPQASLESSLDAGLPDPIVTADPGPNPEEEALLADSVGLALLVVLETLTPAERLAFVLHDLFDLPFDEIAVIVDRSPEAARQLASRARRRVRGAEVPDREPDLARQREVVKAFEAAARAGDFERLVAVLDPDVVLRADFGPRRRLEVHRGAPAVASQAGLYRRLAESAEVVPALVNGRAGGIVVVNGQPFAIMGFTVHDGRIVEMDVINEPARVARLAAPVLGG